MTVYAVRSTHFSLVSAMKDIIVDEEVVAEVGELVLHISEKSADDSCEVDDMRGLVLVEYRFGLAHVPALGTRL